MSSWLGHRLPRYLFKHYYVFVCEGFFWMRLIFGWVDRVKQNILSNVGGTHLIKRTPEYSRKADLSAKTRELLVLDFLSWSFPAFGLELKHLHSQGHEPAGFQTGTDTISSLVLGPWDWDWNYNPWSPACWLQRTLTNTSWLLAWHTWQNVTGSQEFTGVCLGPSMASRKQPTTK